MKRFARFLIVFALLTAGVVSAQNMADYYRQAARAYRDAAARAPADQRACYLRWAEYMECVASTFQSGSNATCSQPKCVAGQPE